MYLQVPRTPNAPLSRAYGDGLKREVRHQKNSWLLFSTALFTAVS